MANYAYLFETRLNPSQRAALTTVQETAKQQNLTAFLVGGAVRDLTAGLPVRDLDFVVQGDASLLLPGLEAAGGVRAGEQADLDRYFFIFPGGARVEVGSSLNVSYPEPAKPVTEPSSVLEDLRRRDFTVNAMAVSLNEGSYGLLMDPLNGIADLENRELRLVSPYGFIEEPSRLLRATRLAARLGFSLEERTQTRFENAKGDAAIDRLGDWERGYELEEIFHEDDPAHIVEELTAQGWHTALGLAWTPADVDAEAMERLRDLHGQLDALGVQADSTAVAFPILTAKMPAAKLSALKQGFSRPGFAAQIDALETKAKELGAKLSGQSATTPSETWKLLFASDPETVLRTAFGARSGALQTKFRQFLNEWPQARQRIPYAQMAEMRIQPTMAGYDQLVEDLFFGVMDGRLDTPEAIRAYLEPIAPPAPVSTTSPRRRAAKATKSKTKKASKAAAEAGVEGEGLSETPVSTPAKEPAAKPESTGKPAEKSAKKAAPVKQVPATKKAPEKAAVTGSAVKKAAKEVPAKTAAVPSKKAATKAAAAPPARKAPAGPATAPTKSAPAKKSVAAPVKAGAKTTAKEPAKATVAAKKTTPQKVAPKKSVAPAKVVAKKAAPTKTPAKGAPSKAAKGSRR